MALAYRYICVYCTHSNSDTPSLVVLFLLRDDSVKQYLFVSRAPSNVNQKLFSIRAFFFAL